jgi:RNase P subunit RPR2
MKTRLRMKCRVCGSRNRFEVEKRFVEQLSLEPKVKIALPMYEPLKVETCKKCGQIIAEPKELIRIVHQKTWLHTGFEPAPLWRSLPNKEIGVPSSFWPFPRIEWSNWFKRLVELAHQKQR